MSLSLYVDGSPAVCRAAARDLGRLAGSLDLAGDTLASTGSTVSGSWTGEAGELCHDRVKQLLAQADRTSATTERVAAALDQLADSLATARSLMRRARAAALRSDLPLAGDELPDLEVVRASAVDPVAAQVAYAAVAALAEAARAAEAAGQAAWRGALGQIHDLAPLPEVRVVHEDTSGSGGWRDLVPDVGLPDVGVPDLPDPPDLPDIPHVPWDEYPFPGLSGIPTLDTISSGLRQILDDDGTPLPARLGGGWLVGEAAGVGGALGLAYCAASARRSKSMLMPGDALDCGKQGGERGRDFGRRFVEVLRDH